MLNPIEPLSKMNLRTIRKKYPRLILWGGVDNTQLLPFGKVEEVEAGMRQAIDDCATGGGYLRSKRLSGNDEAPLRILWRFALNPTPFILSY